ncbi:BppU family phage baseplate upper protein [Bacillus mycoides]|uniref:BppU family phage baseplate upper protein n=1 Tax=Bacillus mycoides TaxID=1405 RepID=UPI002E1B1187|nr:BppU family phage baseplate upper protein [Bacillus mycoides]
MKTKLILDINKTQYAQLNSIVTGRVGDKAENIVDVYIVSGSIPYDLTGSEIYFECAKPDNSYVRDKNGIVMKSASQGHFEYTFPAQTFGAVGKSKQAYFSIEKNKSVKATTQDFVLVTLPDASTNRIPSAAYISQLDELIKDLEGMQLDVLNSEAYQEARDAKAFAEQAKNTSNQANTTSNSVQEQLNQVVISGSIDPETKQARVDGKGVSFPLLKDRLDNDAQKVNTLEKKIDFVTPEQYGAIGNGLVDDGPALKATHEDANAKGLNVVYGKGKSYLVGDAANVPIQTSVDYNGSTLILDLVKNPDSVAFHVKYTKPSITLDATKREALNGKIKKGVKNIPELAGYGDAYVYAQDSNKRTYIRYGGNANTGQSMTEWFMINNNGDILNPLHFDLDTVTFAVISPSDDEYLTLKNINVISRGLVTGDNYLARNFRIERSRIVIDGFNHVIEQNVAPARPCSGIIQMQRCGDIHLKNTNLVPRMPHNSIGTYDLGTNNVCDLTLDNVQGYATGVEKWGVFGGNQMKNLLVKNSSLNRIDSHTGSNTITIENSRIGERGLTLTGFGDLRIINTELNSNEALVLRGDYGALWDGDIYFEDVTHILYKTGYALINFQPELRHKFGYPLKVGGNRISVKNYHVVNPWGGNVLNLISPKVSRGGAEATDVNSPEIAPHWSFENLTSTGVGFNLFKGNAYHEVRVAKDSSYTQSSQVSETEISNTIGTNMKVDCTNVQFHDYRYLQATEMSNIVDTNISLLGANFNDTFLSENKRIVPEINIKNCGYVYATTFAYPMVLNIDNSTVHCAISVHGGGSRAKVSFNNCELAPKVASYQYVYFKANKINTFLTSCIFLPAQYQNGNLLTDGSFRTTYDIVNFNGTENAIKQGCNLSACTIDSRIVMDSQKSGLVDYDYVFGNSSYLDIFPRKSGATTARPEAQNTKTGDVFYDSTLKKVIYRVRTSWVDANGTSV